MSSSPDPQPPPGVVELREDVPLKPGGPAPRSCAGGPRFIIAAFAALTVAITLALLTQIYYGDYEVVPHGSVSSSAAECSRAGVLVLRAGGRSADAAAAAALCLTLIAPHRTSLDASGSLVYWEYRSSQTELPTTAEWGGVPASADTSIGLERPPRLLVALADLHSRYGALPWSDVVQTAIDTAREGFKVSDLVSAQAEARGVMGYVAGAVHTDPLLADYLETVQHNASSALCEVWSCEQRVRWRSGVVPVSAGTRHVWTSGAGGALAATALEHTFHVDNITAADALLSVVNDLQAQARTVGSAWPGGVASGLAVVDPKDTYIALVTGLSQPFGSGPTVGVWTQDSPTTPLDLAPAIIVDPYICGTRYIIGAESGAALAQGAASALAGSSVVEAAEGGRVVVGAGGLLAREAGRPLPPAVAPPVLAEPPLPALNIVQQRVDALLSHADSRGGGLASRF